MEKINYNKLMMEEVARLETKPRLLLHSCCGPCSSHTINELKEHFSLDVYFYNPNIHPEEEYEKRLKDQVRLVKEMGLKYKVIDGDYFPEEFFNEVRGLESLGEGSKRCYKCFYMRLYKTGLYGLENDFQYFTTTLTISPMKNSQVINEIGLEIGRELGIKYLASDFKKNNGYKKSIDLSKEYKLYRQDYCGCIFSKEETRNRLKIQENI